MKITLVREGGFANVTVTNIVDTAALSKADAERVTALARAAKSAPKPKKVAARDLQPDRFEYTLTIEDGGKPTTIKVSEQAVPDELKPLIDYVRKSKPRS